MILLALLLTLPAALLLAQQPPIPAPPPLPVISDALAGIIVGGIVAIVLGLASNFFATLLAWLTARDAAKAAGVANVNAAKAAEKVDTDSAANTKTLELVHTAVNSRSTALETKITNLEGIVLTQAAQIKALTTPAPCPIAPAPAAAAEKLKE